MSMLTKWGRAREAKRFGYHQEKPETLWRRLIVEHAPGRTFVDVGCMWQVNGEYAFLAADHGAASVTGIDVVPATTAFEARNAARADPIRFVQADLNDPDVATRAGTFDVVFCAGVLYHVPNPVYSLEQLRRLCRGTLILATANMPERETPNVAVLLAGLDDETRERMRFGTPRGKAGLDTRFTPEAGYANWVWLPTPSCVRAMVTLAGFAVDAYYPTRRVTTIVARPSAAIPWVPS